MKNRENWQDIYHRLPAEGGCAFGFADMAGAAQKIETKLGKPPTRFELGSGWGANAFRPSVPWLVHRNAWLDGGEEAERATRVRF